MTIEFNEQIRAIWFVQVNPAVDWMASLSETEPGKGQLTYRFRYYADDKTFGSEDKKNWYVFKGEYKKLLDSVKEMAEGMSAEYGTLFELIRGQRSLEDFAAVFREQPFVHVKEAPADAPTQIHS